MKKSKIPPERKTFLWYEKLLLSNPGAEKGFPFGPGVAVYKVKGKMFATLTLEDGMVYSNLKCDPDLAWSLRKKYKAIQPGYHMNKRHWNTLTLDGSLPKGLIQEMTHHSYLLAAPKPKNPQEIPRGFRATDFERPAPHPKVKA